ncbi:hypothetical protein NC661_15890 [Aquibacillus koreensis]|uniref:Uncharacterized protein n=1 Tax=Aquibacillus koreensis TaxID=279446 RepID=A0A9X4AJB6_9BACI|nr:hypothetical protein [Aquibacillus koreensis]MCT2534550.1 hypothetical protein [Aquibacillus koreensis]MDC3421856.1 hypothetical protein [Aquibacillus koreensis]
MIYFLLFMSFLLHIVSFILIKTFRDKLKEVDQLETTQKQNVKEMEDLLAVYLLEIKDENEKLVKVLQENEHVQRKEKKRQPISSHVKEDMYTVEDREQKEADNTLQNVERKTTKRKEEYNDYNPPIDRMEQQDVLEQSTSAKVMSLYEQGNSVEAIAKKLDCGKTEVELLLKFHRKNS